jgi:hypothetical protein
LDELLAAAAAGDRVGDTPEIGDCHKQRGQDGEVQRRVGGSRARRPRLGRAQDLVLRRFGRHGHRTDEHTAAQRLETFLDGAHQVIIETLPTLVSSFDFGRFTAMTQAALDRAQWNNP